MKKTVFISYDFSDKAFMGEIKKWLEESGISVIVVDEKNLEPESDRQAEIRIKQQIHDSDILLILVGNNTHNRPWVDCEVKIARSIPKPAYWIRLPNRTGGPPKEVAGLPPLQYDRNEIIKALK